MKKKDNVTFDGNAVPELEGLTRFQMVLLAASRAKEIINGSEVLIPVHYHKATTTALEEIASGKVTAVKEPVAGPEGEGEEAPEILVPIEHVEEEKAEEAEETQKTATKATKKATKVKKTTKKAAKKATKKKAAESPDS